MAKASSDSELTSSLLHPIDDEVIATQVYSVLIAVAQYPEGRWFASVTAGSGTGDSACSAA
jgi:hypothetical protein